MYKIKNLAQRSAAFVAAVGLLSGVVTSALPGLVSADALNPLTERSLTLSSSSPGFHYLDGSGNATYAPPGSGNNGQKTGETFTFRTSTDSSSGTAIKGFSFQWCTYSAGHCTGPGNDVITDADGPSDPTIQAVRSADDATHTDLSVHYSSSPVAGTDFKIEYFVPDDDGAGPHVDAWVDASTGWTIATSNVEDPVHADYGSGRDNYVKLAHATGLTTPAGTQMRITFIASDDNYITNPGADAFFVKINDYDSNTSGHLVASSGHVIDGGVTVANVMNDSIQIQTKVLETMSFSVGTTNPDTVFSDDNHDGDHDSGETHGTCDPVRVNNALDLGNPDAEFSLETGKTYEVKSYWRLSSNSSGGATVYYSGNTLSNTVGDNVDAIGTTAQSSHQGTEQFGLALSSTADTLDSQMTTQISDDAGLSTPLQFPHLAPHLTPLIAKDGTGGFSDYSHGAGDINTTDSSGTTAQFAFDPASLTIPVPIANENADVVNCATGKMRYIANIAATTPAGVYTSRINYIAAPEY